MDNVDSLCGIPPRSGSPRSFWPGNDKVHSAPSKNEEEIRKIDPVTAGYRRFGRHRAGEVTVKVLKNLDAIQRASIGWLLLWIVIITIQALTGAPPVGVSLAEFSIAIGGLVQLAAIRIKCNEHCK